MATSPKERPVTTPFVDTVATVASFVLQEILGWVNALPAESRGVAIKVIVLPESTLGLFGVIATDFTGLALTKTVIAEFAVFPSTVAVIVAEPAPIPVVIPEVPTFATDGAELAQRIFRPLRV